MKLIFCRVCKDVVALTGTERQCYCGKSSGKYVGTVHAEISGQAIPLGINNVQIAEQIDNWIFDDETMNINLWVFSKDHPHIYRRQKCSTK